VSARRRVVITGVGAVTPIGTAADGLWAGLEGRRSAVRALTRFDPSPFRSKIAAEIPDFRPQDFLDAKRAKRLDRFSQLAVTSARLALQDGALEPTREDPDRVGAMMGSALGGVAVEIVHEWAGPPWPLVGRLAADAVIGPVFVHGIASRTLAGIRRRAEAA